MSFHTLPEHSFRTRTKLLAAGVVAVCFTVLIGRLYYLTIVQGDWLSGKAAAQQLRDTEVPADRGEIYSSDGTLLATNASCWTIRASPREMAEESIALAAQGIAEILELEEEDVLALFSERTSNDCLLKQRVDRMSADAVRDFCEENDITGVLINQDTKRYYPEGELLASVLGFTNVDNVGVSGLELEYDSVLTGTDGMVLTASNAWGYTLDTSYVTALSAEQGDSLVLTIDANIQYYLENTLNYGVQETNVAARAVGIVMDVNTGEILAMATTPSYDPNEPRVIYDEETRLAVEALEGDEQTEARTLAQQTQWRNKAVSDLYEPGSVFKLITASAALDAGVITMEDTFLCSDSINVSGTTFHCANNKSHGLQTVTETLMNSCNQGLIQIGARLGADAFFDYFEAYGLCAATGIDLPAEPESSEYYTADELGPVELASCSFGQSSKITYLQMITAVCAVVNGGYLMQPYVVSQVLDSEGNVISETEPEVKTQVISEETSANMRQIMLDVVELGGGANAQIQGYEIGGKSGTSQKLDSEDSTARIASFVAVAPMDDPQVAVLICYDEPHTWTTSGGGLSAPACAEVLEQILTYWGVPMTEEETIEAIAIVDLAQ
ncbi:MAG: penicillin-binding transpeptidase domain-containing protein [Faecalibacterium sp.]